MALDVPEARRTTDREAPTVTRWVAVLAAVALVGCLQLGGEPEQLGFGFRNVTDEAGVDHVVGQALPGRVSVMATVSGGVSMADVDGDGNHDLLVTDAGRNTLWRGHGDGTFTNVTDEAGIQQGAFTTMGLFFDYDDDGDPDLLLVNFGSLHRLYRNDGGWNLTDVTQEAGVDFGSWAYGAHAADVNGDGHLDFTILNYGAWPKVAPDSNAAATNAGRDLLFVNQGNGTFREEGVERGLTAKRWTLGHAFGDYDDDGDPDLYLNADFGWDVLYENDGSGNFTDVTREAGTLTNGNGMGPVWTDVDGDLDLDLFATNVHLPDHGGIEQFTGNDLWENRGDGTFRQAAPEAGVADGGWGWDSEWQDFDHDGDVDAPQANGMSSQGGPDHPDQFYDAVPRLLDEEPQGNSPRHAYSEPYNETKWLLLEYEDHVNVPVENPAMGSYQVDRFFRNQGDGTFEDAAEDVGLGGWADARAYASADLDGDGDLDLVRSVAHRPLEVYENTLVDGGTPDDAHWLQVELEGTTSNRDALGARVVAEAGDLTVLRHVHAGGGFMSQSSKAVHFGLGTREVVDELRVEWPSGATTLLEDVGADQRLHLVEGEG